MPLSCLRLQSQRELPVRAVRPRTPLANTRDTCWTSEAWLRCPAAVRVPGSHQVVLLEPKPLLPATHEPCSTAAPAAIGLARSGGTATTGCQTAGLKRVGCAGQPVSVRCGSGELRVSSALQLGRHQQATGGLAGETRHGGASRQHCHGRFFLVFWRSHGRGRGRGRGRRSEPSLRGG